MSLNQDMLAWFREDERELCPACGERACIGLTEVLATFCLGCAAIWVGGERLDRNGRIPIGRAARQSSATLPRAVFRLHPATLVPGT